MIKFLHFGRPAPHRRPPSRGHRTAKISYLWRSGTITTHCVQCNKSCKAAVKSSPPANQHPVFIQVGCPSCRPTNSVRKQDSSGLVCSW